MINLDYLCMKYAQEITNININSNINTNTNTNIDNNNQKNIELRNLINKALGILQEDGVYAMIIWLKSKKNNKNTSSILEKLFNSITKEKELSTIFLKINNSSYNEDYSNDNFLKIINDAAKNIDKLFLMKKLFHRILTYAYYHLK